MKKLKIPPLMGVDASSGEVTFVRDVLREAIDLAFLVEIKQRLAKARAGDATEFEMVEKMLDDWIDELQTETTP